MRRTSRSASGGIVHPAGPSTPPTIHTSLGRPLTALPAPIPLSFVLAIVQQHHYAPVAKSESAGLVF